MWHRHWIRLCAMGFNLMLAIFLLTFSMWHVTTDHAVFVIYTFDTIENKFKKKHSDTHSTREKTWMCLFNFRRLSDKFFHFQFFTYSIFITFTLARCLWRLFFLHLILIYWRRAIYWKHLALLFYTSGDYTINWILLYLFVTIEVHSLKCATVPYVPISFFEETKIQLKINFPLNCGYQFPSNRCKTLHFLFVSWMRMRYLVRKLK